MVEIGFIYPKTTTASSIHLRVGTGEHFFQHRRPLDQAQKLLRGLKETLESLPLG